MPPLWTAQSECLDAIGADEDLAAITLRMARLARAGKLALFTACVASDVELEPGTREWVLALARNEPFLLIAELVLSRSRDVN